MKDYTEIHIVHEIHHALTGRLGAPLRHHRPGQGQLQDHEHRHRPAEDHRPRHRTPRPAKHDC